MRLIDADKLSVVTWTDTEGYPDDFDSGVQWAFEQVDKQPTIEAIPISYIQKYIQGFDANGYLEFAASLEALLMDWREEHETN